jgi:hypothetical protein
MKTRKYVLKAIPERVVVLIPLTGTKTLLTDFNAAVRTQGIPRNASVSIITRHDGTRSVRAVWATTN